METDFDYVIVGAGCAGLSLAVHLVDAGLPADRRVLIVDPRTDFPRDRTWCFFDVLAHPFEAGVSHRWNRWAVADDERVVTQTSDEFAYQHLPGDAFYTIARARIAEHPGITLGLGRTVTAVHDLGDRVRVDTDTGPITARLALDSRPGTARTFPGATDGTREVRLLQHFHGWFVETKEDHFDPSTAMLMDFRADQREGIHFLYTLPFSPRLALIEDTFFSAEALPAERYAETLDRHIAALGIDDYTVTHTERGVIPMTTEAFEQRPSPRVYRIGLVGGLARPATGYAFLAIQRFSKAMAEALVAAPVAATPSPPPSRNAWTALLDRCFLSHLDEHPERAPAVFTRLFDRVPPDVLVRFLSETGGFSDDFSIMRSLPTLPFAQSMVRALDGLVRRRAAAPSSSAMTP